MKFHVPAQPPHGTVDSLISARDQDIVRCGRAKQPAYDPRNLMGSFSVPVHYFGKTLAQATVVVDLGEPKILEWQVPQPPDRLCDRHAPGAHALEEPLNVFLVHRLSEIISF
jgi:hypothetical protein